MAESWFAVHPAACLLVFSLLLCGGGEGPGTLMGVEGWVPAPVLTSRDLQQNMYPAAGHYPCVLLLNTTGGVGCSSTCAISRQRRGFRNLQSMPSSFLSLTLGPAHLSRSHLFSFLARFRSRRTCRFPLARVSRVFSSRPCGASVTRSFFLNPSSSTHSCPA